MDKIKLNTMGIFPKPEEQTIQIGEATVYVQTYIPYEQMLDMIQWCIDYIINDRPFLSAPLKRIMKNFAILKFYTNFDLGFLETYHNMSDIYAEYDYIQRFGVLEQILPLIDADQLKFFNETLDETLVSIIAYRNSAVGIVEALASNAKTEVSDMQQALDLLKSDENSEEIKSLMDIAKQISGAAAPKEEPPKEVASPEK